jgi:hypothetical protein
MNNNDVLPAGSEPDKRFYPGTMGHVRVVAGILANYGSERF